MNTFLVAFGIIITLIIIGGIWITRPTKSDSEGPVGRGEPKSPSDDSTYKRP
jgi:hypothetical protein